jgi:hypothetical protein
MRYYLLFFNEEMEIRESLNVDYGHPASLEECLQAVDRTKQFTRLRYFIVPEREYLTCWKDKLGTKITS